MMFKPDPDPDLTNATGSTALVSGVKITFQLANLAEGRGHINLVLRKQNSINGSFCVTG